jgi:hypothetical protein
MEVYFREKLQYSRFIIVCRPAKADSSPSKKSFAHYYRGQGFVIYYQDNLTDKEKRTHIAHELGHLFLVALKDKDADHRKEVDESSVEPLSSILGLFTISDKNDHQANMAGASYNHASWQEILDDFKAIEDE